MSQFFSFLVIFIRCAKETQQGCYNILFKTKENVNIVSSELFHVYVDVSRREKGIKNVLPVSQQVAVDHRF